MDAFLDKLLELDKNATPVGWIASDRKTLREYREMAADGDPFTAMMPRRLDGSSLTLDTEVAGLMYQHPERKWQTGLPARCLMESVNADLIVLLRNAAPRLAALVEVVARLPDGQSGDDPYEYVRSDELRSIRAALTALDTEPT